MKITACPVCGVENVHMSTYDPLDQYEFYECPTCGRFEIDSWQRLTDFNPNHLPSYLFYHRFQHNAHPTEYRYHTPKDKDFCDKWSEQFKSGNPQNGYPVHIDNDMVEAWYPRAFSERIDHIIRYLGTHIEHIGQRIWLSYSEALSLLFIDRKERQKDINSPELVDRSDDAYNDEAKYLLDSMSDAGIIEYAFGGTDEEAVFIRLTPKGYARVDELQKNTAYGKAVLVAMKFGEDTIPLREAIRKGITDAGYVAIFIDEVQHNDFITPELLKHIRDSKFVVVDLTHQNNGAYFEEGYAMGLGKPVIQLCRHDTRLHFDIAQKNTIMWQSEDEIPERLRNRIKATID